MQLDSKPLEFEGLKYGEFAIFVNSEKSFIIADKNVLSAINAENNDKSSDEFQ